MYEGYLEADVSYSNDIGVIKGLNDLSADSISTNLSQLLAGFFSFYLNIFNPDSHVLSVSHPDGPLLPYGAYLAELQHRFSKDRFILNGFVEDVRAHKWTFLIADPFDRTYNPAKQVVSFERLESQYFAAMQETLDGLTEQGEVWLDPCFYPPNDQVGTYNGLPMVQNPHKKGNRR